MNKNTLPGIVEICFIRCADIPPHSMLASMCNATVVLNLDSKPVKFYGFPQLKWEGGLTNGSRQEKSTLQFASSDILPENERIAFVVTTAGGNQYLIGAREPNYPIISFSESAGVPDGEAAVRTYTITHIAIKSIIPCIL